MFRAEFCFISYNTIQCSRRLYITSKREDDWSVWSQDKITFSKRRYTPKKYESQDNVKYEIKSDNPITTYLELPRVCYVMKVEKINGVKVKPSNITIETQMSYSDLRLIHIPFRKCKMYRVKISNLEWNVIISMNQNQIDQNCFPKNPWRVPPYAFYKTA